MLPYFGTLFILALVSVTALSEVREKRQSPAQNFFGVFLPTTQSLARPQQPVPGFTGNFYNNRNNNNINPRVASTNQPKGIKITNYRFQNCTSSFWTPHYFWVEYFDFSPAFPTFPGSIHINMSVWVNQTLPRDLDAQFEIHAAKFSSLNQNPFELVLCHGYDLNTGCGGLGSCKYCDIINNYCFKHLPPEECPPRRGRYSVTFSQNISEKDIPNSLIGQLRSTQYWIKVALTSRSTGEEMACGRVLLDVCKFHTWDPNQACVP